MGVMGDGWAVGTAYYCMQILATYWLTKKGQP